VYAWDENKFGQIGNGSNNDQLENPIRIEGFDNEKVVMISCGLSSQWHSKRVEGFTVEVTKH
jgi:alpha-tubulin suppressor-like RCC1 family protein